MTVQAGYMKLTILGTASHIPTRDRNQNAYFLDTGREGWLFDPGEGTQRQFTLAGISPGRVHRIFISHFHGDHCLGLPGMMQRLSLMQVPHQIGIFYPEEGQEYIDRLSRASRYTQGIAFDYHPLKHGDIIEDERFRVEAIALKHSTPVLGYRVTQKARLHFDPALLKKAGLSGPQTGILEKRGRIEINAKLITREELSYRGKAKVFAYALDTGVCENIPRLIRNADCLLMEGTYLESEKALAEEFLHMTAEQTARYAKGNAVKRLLLTHYSERYKDLDFYQKAVDKVFKNTHIAKDFDVIEF